MPQINWSEINPFRKDDEPKTAAEFQEKSEQLDAELTYLQKKQMYEKLKQNGLSVKGNFGGSLKKAWQWFITH